MYHSRRCPLSEVPPLHLLWVGRTCAVEKLLQSKGCDDDHRSNARNPADDEHGETPMVLQAESVDESSCQHKATDHKVAVQGKVTLVGEAIGTMVVHVKIGVFIVIRVVSNDHAAVRRNGPKKHQRAKTVNHVIVDPLLMGNIVRSNFVSLSHWIAAQHFLRVGPDVEKVMSHFPPSATSFAFGFSLVMPRSFNMSGASLIRW